LDFAYFKFLFAQAPTSFAILDLGFLVFVPKELGIASSGAFYFASVLLLLCSLRSLVFRV